MFIENSAITSTAYISSGTRSGGAPAKSSTGFGSESGSVQKSGIGSVRGSGSGSLEFDSVFRIDEYCPKADPDTLQKVFTENRTLKEIGALPGVDEYRANLIKQGAVEQSVVIKRDGVVAGSIGVDGSATFQTSSLQYLWEKSGRKMDNFLALLEMESYEIEVYEAGEGPSYGEVYQLVSGESYSDLVDRLTSEYLNEMLSSGGFGRLQY